MKSFTIKSLLNLPQTPNPSPSAFAPTSATNIKEQCPNTSSSPPSQPEQLIGITNTHLEMSNLSHPETKMPTSNSKTHHCCEENTSLNLLTDTNIILKKFNLSSNALVNEVSSMSFLHSSELQLSISNSNENHESGRNSSSPIKPNHSNSGITYNSSSPSKHTNQLSLGKYPVQTP